MPSERKVQANRQNALRSTGPRTAAGKAKVAKNPITHGLLSRETLLPEEDAKTLGTLAEGLRRELNPMGALEHLQVDLVIWAVWRLRRLGRVEVDIYSLKQGPSKEQIRQNVVFYDPPDPPTPRATFYFPKNGREILEPTREADDAKQMGGLSEKKTMPVGFAFMRGSAGGDAFSKLSRYEAGIERSYYRALHELQRLQHARLGGRVPPPSVLDVTVSGRDEGGPDGLITTLRPSGKGQPGPAVGENDRPGLAEHTQLRTPAEPENALEDELFE